MRTAPLPALALALALCALLAGAPGLLAQVDGADDGSFWGDGRTSYPVGTSGGTLEGLAVAPDGRLVFGARWNDANLNGHGLWRAVGDTTHGPPCTVTLPGLAHLLLLDLAFDSAGRLVVGGTAGVDSESAFEPFLARYLYPTCTLDPAFSGDGWRTLDASELFASTSFADLAIDAAGRIVVAGSGSGGASTPIVFRVVEAGGLDSTFSGDGRATAPAGQGATRAVALAPNGRVVLAVQPEAAANVDFRLVSFSAAGAHLDTLDVPFDLGGQDHDLVSTLAVAPDGRIVAAGAATTSTLTLRAAVARLRWNAAGLLEADPTFGGGDGRRDFLLGGGTTNSLFDALVQGDGKIVLAGYSGPSLNGDTAMAVARLTEAGGFDPDFFPTGISSGLRLVEFDEGGSNTDRAYEIELQAGRIALGGIATGADNQFAVGLARLHNAYLFADGFEGGTTAAWSGASGPGAVP